MAKTRAVRKRASAAKSAGFRIRMYNVGFGDCFLLTIPGRDKDRKIVVDCGSLKRKQKTIQEISDALIEDCREQDGVSRIDVLIMSHRHADHISGFVNPAWSEVEVGEVWMPWMESRTDPKAKALRKRQLASAIALQNAVVRLGLNPELGDVALNARSNDEALNALHGGFAKRVTPRFFPSGEKIVEEVKSELLPQIEVYVLGPPHDSAALNDASPPKDQSLLTGYIDDQDADASRKFLPLSEDWIDDTSDPLFDADDIKKAVSQIGMYELMAAKIDAELNNTSLILMFRIGNDYLLFPGDAQWGPWEILLEDTDALELLEKVTFLKVGHHASHNASPATLVRDHLGKSNSRGGVVTAMISMTPYSKWKNIPHKPLIEELKRKKFPFVISDNLKDQTGFNRNGDLWFEFSFHE